MQAACPRLIYNRAGRALSGAWRSPMSATTLAPRTDRVHITNARPIPGGGQLVAVFDVELRSGLKLLGCKLFRSPTGPWVKGPDAVRVDRDGHAVLKATGGRVYDDTIGFVTTGARDRWREGVLAAIAIDAPELLAVANAEPAASAGPFGAGALGRDAPRRP